MKRGNKQYLVVIFLNQPIGEMVRAFANGARDLGLIPGRVILKTQDLYASLLHIQHYMVRIKGKVDWFGLGVYGISTFVGYLTPNPFLCK